MAFISSGYNPDKPMENRISDIGPQKYDLIFFTRRSSPRTKANGCITKSSNQVCWYTLLQVVTNATPCVWAVPA